MLFAMPISLKPVLANEWRLVEFRSGTASYSHAFRRDLRLERLPADLAVRSVTSGDGPRVCLAATVGPSRAELATILQGAAEPFDAAVIDFPGRADEPADLVAQFFRSRGLSVTVGCVLSSRFGDAQARFRVVVLGHRDRVPTLPAADVPPPAARSICDAVVDDALWVHLDSASWHAIPVGRNRDEPYSPALAGEFVGLPVGGPPPRIYVWSLDGPVPSITTEICYRPDAISGETQRWRGPLVYDNRSGVDGAASVRMLSDAEIFRLQGSLVDPLGFTGVSYESAVRAALVRGAPPLLASQLLASVLNHPSADHVGRAPTAAGSAGPVRGTASFSPAEQYQLDASDLHRCGGPKRKGPDLHGQLRDQIGTLLAGGQAEGTQAGYRIGWRQWEIFCSGRDFGPQCVFDVRVPEERAEVENALIDYVGILHFVMHRAAGTIRLKVAAVRYGHLTRRLGDPTSQLQAPALSVALESIRRLAPKPRKKLPVTPKAIRIVAPFFDQFFPRGTKLQKLEGRSVVHVGFFYLARQGEMLYDAGIPERAYRSRDIAPKVNGSYVHWDQVFALTSDARCACNVDLTVYFKSSKTDQDALGALRTHRCGCWFGHRAGDAVEPAPSCVVCTVIEYMRERLQHEKYDPDALFFPSWTRAKLARAVKALMTFAEGPETASATDTHSLRIGGCTALYGATENIDLARRWGRWNPASPMPFLYSWDVVGPSGRGIAAAMSEVNFSLHDALVRATKPSAHPLA